MRCTHCNVEALPDSRFCDRCGAPLVGSAPAVAPTPDGPPSIAWATWTDPTEHAFAVQVPRGWRVKGGVTRPGPLPVIAFETTDPSGSVGFMLSPSTHTFTEPVPRAAGMLGLLGSLMGDPSAMMAAMPFPGAQPMPWQPAAALVQSFFLPQWRRIWPDAAVVAMRDQPDETRRHVAKRTEDCHARGMALSVEGAVLDVLIGYTLRGVSMLHAARLMTTRMLGGVGAPLPWYAEVAGSWWAPRDRFTTYEPILRRIFASVQPNPQWEAAELEADNLRSLRAQSDIHRRQMQISQTLSETSDIVSQGYWERERIHAQHEQARQAMGPQDDWQHRYSNAILGWEDRVDDSGQRYSIAAGHERVWRDDGGNLHYGDQLTNPDPAWHELKSLQ
jgi:hypothetical protein